MRKVNENQGKLLLLFCPLDVSLVLLLRETNRQAEPVWHIDIDHIWTSYSHVDRSYFLPPLHLSTPLSDSHYLYCITSLPRLTSASPPLYFLLPPGPLNLSSPILLSLLSQPLPSIQYPPLTPLLTCISWSSLILSSCLCPFGLTLWLVAAILVWLLYFIVGQCRGWCVVHEGWCSCSCDTICLTTEWFQQVDAMSGCRAATQQEERKQISRRTNSLRKYLDHVAGVDTHLVSLKITGPVWIQIYNVHL